VLKVLGMPLRLFLQLAADVVRRAALLRYAGCLLYLETYFKIGGQR